MIEDFAHTNISDYCVPMVIQLDTEVYLIGYEFF